MPPPGDDPHPFGMHPRHIVDGLLGQHRVAGPVPIQPIEDQHVGPLVAGVAEVVRVVEADLLPHREQQFAGVGDHLGGQRRIGQAHQNAGHGIGRRRSGVGITGLSSNATVLACSASTHDR